MIFKVSFSEVCGVMRAVSKAVSNGRGRFKLGGQVFFIESEGFCLDKRGVGKLSPLENVMGR